MIWPSCWANQIWPFALLINFSHACKLYNLLVTGSQKDSGALEEESLSLHLEYLKAEFIVVDCNTILGQGSRSWWHVIVIYCLIVRFEPYVVVFEQRCKMKVILLLLHKAVVDIIWLYLCFIFLQYLVVIPGLCFNLQLQDMNKLYYRLPQMLEWVL